MPDVKTIRLTETVKAGGCASKLSPAVLDKVLGKLPRQHDPNVLVGFDHADDAGVYRIAPDLALVQTVDFFTPIVDDPYTFGQIAATNALSDVYAMGGPPHHRAGSRLLPGQRRPRSSGTNPGRRPFEDDGSELHGRRRPQHPRRGNQVRIFRHRPHSSQPRVYQWRRPTRRPIAVHQGAGHRRHLHRNQARHGKAILDRRCHPFDDNAEQDRQRNHRQSFCSDGATTGHVGTGLGPVQAERSSAGSPVHSLTDITGFGLIGHAREMALASNVSLQFRLHQIPVLEGALDCIRAGNIPGGLKNNREFAECVVGYEEGIAEELKTILFDPQTAGGLLISVAAEACSGTSPHSASRRSTRRGNWRSPGKDQAADRDNGLN